MKIISKFTDYYDYPVKEFGIDNKIVLTRKDKIEKYKFATNLRFPIFSWEFLFQKSFEIGDNRSFITGHSKRGVLYKFGVVVVCGRIYITEVIEIEHHDGGCTYAYSVLSPEEFINKATLAASAYKKHNPVKSSIYEEIITFAKENCVYNKEWDFFHRTFNSYILIPAGYEIISAIDVDSKYDYWKKQFINSGKVGEPYLQVCPVIPTLKSLNFPRIVSAQQMYQNVSMWLGQQISCNPPVEVNDEDKIAKAGFNKKSFRKDKTKGNK